MKSELNSHRIGLEHQHGRLFFILCRGDAEYVKKVYFKREIDLKNLHSFSGSGTKNDAIDNKNSS